MTWQEDKEKITEAYFTAINISNIELFGVIKENYEKVKPIYPLIEFIIERLVTVTDLTTQDKVWDAEIVYRSALEAYIKLIFITSADEAEQKIRLQEYWHDLSEIYSIKLSEQAKKNLAAFPDNEMMKIAYSPLILGEEKEKELRAKWPKSIRQKIEQKWSFSEMIASLTKNYRGKKSDAFIGLTHHYRMASHVSHADETGVLIIKEREERTTEEKAIANFSHYIRLMSDSFCYTNYIGVETLAFINKNPKFFIDLFKSMKEIQELGHKYQMKLYDDPSYEKYK